MSPIAPATRQRGPLPRTPGKPTAKRSGAVKSSPTGPREARREAVLLDGRVQRSYPHQPQPHSPNPWVRKSGRSIKGSDTPQLPKRSNAPTVRTSYGRATSARCWRRRTTSTCFSTTAPSSLIRRESSPAATRTRERARCPSARANTSEDERFQAAAARWHARFVLEADLPLREAEGVMTLLCRLRGADRHIVRRRLLLSVERAGLTTREIDSAVGAERVTRPGDATAARQSMSCARTRPHRSLRVSRRPNRRPRSEA